MSQAFCLVFLAALVLVMRQRGMRREGVLAIAVQFPCPQPDPSLQSWECPGVSGETEVCISLQGASMPLYPGLQN